MSVTSYVVVKNWRKFQHYGDDRRPVWIKNYVALLDDPAYLGLTDVQRALLHGLWLWYAMAKTCVPLDLKMINRKLGLSVKMATIEPPQLLDLAKSSVLPRFGGIGFPVRQSDGQTIRVTARSRTGRKKSPHAPRGGDVSYSTLGSGAEGR